MNVVVRVVASLFATLCLILGYTQAQAQQTMSLHEFTRVDSFACNGQTMPGGSLFIEVDSKTTTSQLASFFPVGSSDRAFIESFSTELEFMLNRGSRLDEVIGQWRATGKVRTVYELPAQGQAVPEGFMTVHRVYIPETCSHNFVSMNEKIMGTTVQELSGGRFLRDSDGPRYMVRKPSVSNSPPVPFGAVCPLGTQAMYLAFSGPKHRRFVSWVDQKTFGQLPGWSDVETWNHLFSTEGVHCVPAEVEFTYNVNNNPLRESGDHVDWARYLTKCDVQRGNCEHIRTRGLQPRLEFDQSRDTLINPLRVPETLLLKAVTTTTVDQSLSRIAALPYEKNGKIVTLGSESEPNGRKVWLYDPVADSATFLEDLPMGQKNMQGLIVGKMLIVVTERNSNTASSIHAYNLDTGVKLPLQIDLPLRVGQGSAGFAFRPELSFSPEDGSGGSALYMALPEFGTLYRVEINSGGVYTQIPIPQPASGTCGASDVEADTSRRVLYVTTRCFTGEFLNSVTVNGKVFEFPFGVAGPSRSIEIGKTPWQLAVGKVGGAQTLFITQSFQEPAPGIPGSIARINVESGALTEILPRWHTLGQPNAITLQFK